jgi:cell shape-determining protein MreC
MVAGALALVTLVLVLTPVGAWVRARAGNLLLPLERRLASSGTGAGAGSATASAPAGDEAAGDLRAEIAHLQAENQLLRDRLSDYQAIRGEGGMPLVQSLAVRARIVARSARAGRRYLELDAGAADGVARGQAAVSGYNLIGVVAGVQDSRCLVQEVCDGESRIGAVVLGERQQVADGVCAGGGRAGALALQDLPDLDHLGLAVGQAVLTAGGEGLPRGLVLGAIATAVPPGGGLDHWQVTVAPLRTSANLESLIILAPQPVPQPPARPAP